MFSVDREKFDIAQKLINKGASLEKLLKNKDSFKTEK